MYDVFILGAGSIWRRDVAAAIIRRAAEYELPLDRLSISFAPPEELDPRRPQVAVFVAGSARLPEDDLGAQTFVDAGRTILPVLPSGTDVTHLPECLQLFLAFEGDDLVHLADAVLDAHGLARGHRRAFVSYRTSDGRRSASELERRLSATFDVFLDRRANAHGTALRETLSEGVASADVLVLLHTPHAHESEWIQEELDFAQVRGASILRVAWPGTAPWPRLDYAETIQLDYADLRQDGVPRAHKMRDIVAKAEELRARSVVTRRHRLEHAVVSLARLRSFQAVTDPLHRWVDVHRGGVALARFVTLLGLVSSADLQHAADLGSLGPTTRAGAMFDRVGYSAGRRRHLAFLAVHVPVDHWSVDQVPAKLEEIR